MLPAGIFASRRNDLKVLKVIKDFKVEKCGFLQEFANFRTFLYFCVGNNYNTKYYDYYSR